MKYANFCIKLCSINEEMDFLKVSILKRSFETAVWASAVDVDQSVATGKGL